MMKSPILSALALCCAVLAGCGGMQAAPARLYDLGLPPATTPGPGPALPPLALAEVSAPETLDSPLMYYRLAYADGHRPQAYANSRWSMPPADLFAQRLRVRIGLAGGSVLPTAAGARGLPLLQLEANEFGQVFDSAEHSNALISMRLSVLSGRRLLGQKTFMRQAPTPSADAAGGVAALSQASDAMIDDMLAWLSTLPLKP